jgi:predicted phage terminase large subunit-like protein
MLRADTVAAASEREEVRLVRAPWNREFLHEVQHFPFGKHDDQVDALSGAYQDLTQRGGKFVTW